MSNMKNLLDNITLEEMEAVAEELVDTVSGEDLEKIEAELGDFEEIYLNWCTIHGEEFMEKWIKEHGEVTNVNMYMSMCRDAVNLCIKETLELR